MRSLRLVFVAALLLGCRGSDTTRQPLDSARADAATDPAALCARLCAVRDQVTCARPLPGCVDSCVSAVSGPCATAWLGAYGCSAAHGPQDYECDQRGQPQLKGGACGDQFMAVQTCVAEELAKGR